MPLSIILVYVAKLEVYGVWYALISAAGSIAIILFIRILKVDYDFCLNLVRKRFVLEKESFKKSYKASFKDEIFLNSNNNDDNSGECSEDYKT